MSSFNEIINSENPVLVDFFAEWCGPCKMMKPILEELKKSVVDQFTILKIDIDKNRALAIHYGIQSVPTLIIFKEGKPIWRQSGVMQPQALKEILEKYKK